MSHVVLAEDLHLGRRVALKQMNASSDSDAMLRLRREALIGASVSHPNLVSIYDIVASGGGEYVIVMEYVDGKTLHDELADGGRLPSPKVLTILDGVAAGLDAIHAHQIVHRDVKPANILLAASGDVKLADLGIASAPDRTRITAEGVILGTFAYMAPEQLDGKPATSATDVYALAAVAYEALSGRKARRETNPVALAHAISTRPAPDLRDAWPEAPAEAADLLVRAMAADPATRPRSATDFVRLLRDALERPAILPFAPPTAPMLPSAPFVAATDRGPADTEPVRASRAASATGVAPPATRQPQARQGNGRPPQSPGIQRGAPVVYSSGATSAKRLGRIVPVLGLVLVAAIVGVLLSSGSPTRKRAAQAGSRHQSVKSGAATHPAPGPKTGRSTSAANPSASSSGSQTPATGSPQSTAATSSASTPISATESFYTLAAAHRYADAWALADPTFRSQLGGYQSFESGQALDRSITFTAASVETQSADTATVAVRTTSVRANGTQHCYGTVDLLRSSSTWLLHLIHINCA